MPRGRARARAGVRRRAGARCAAGERLAFAAPPLLRAGPGRRRTTSAAIARALRIDRDDVARRRSGSTTDRAGSGCCSPTPAAVLAARRPTAPPSAASTIGVVGPYPDGSDVRRRGARVLPRRRHRRGPGHRQPQRRPRPVAGRRPPARRRTSPPRAPSSAGAAGCTSSASRADGVGGRRHPHDGRAARSRSERPTRLGPCSSTSTSSSRILDEGVEKSDRTGTGTRQRLRPPDALRPQRRASRW